MFAQPNGSTLARLGMVTAKKVAPRAVDRNRVKRIVREVFRLWRPRLSGLDVVVRLRRCPARDQGPGARRELERFLAELAQQAPASV